MSKRFFADDSLELAILSAAREFEVEPKELAYTKIEKKTGFQKGRKRVVILVDAEDFRLEASEQKETAPAESGPDMNRN